MRGAEAETASYGYWTRDEEEALEWAEVVAEAPCAEVGRTVEWWGSIQAYGMDRDSIAKAYSTADYCSTADRGSSVEACSTADRSSSVEACSTVD